LVKNIGFQNNSTHKFLHDSQKVLESGSISFPIIHPPIVVDKEADSFTFDNIYSHSLKRILRLIKDNSVKNIIRYVWGK
jgi:hypothetical protein